ncbi:hypothetical protein [Streptomyces sp. A2-16]|uniref:hypothetical protein n=1 Tax=Streptomyces sp. A2-16 TaxID=2781734 RepID=UPI002011BBE5|nr:hypothetical protein [Streptomyces sp. A2-16]
MRLTRGESVPRPPAAPPPAVPPPAVPPPAVPPAAFPTPWSAEAPVLPKNRRINAVIIGSAAAVIVTTGIVVVGATVGATGDDKPTTGAATASSVPDVEFVSPATEPTYSQVDADSFSIDLRTTSRQCFGSAGCNVTVEPDLTYLCSSGDVDPDAVYEITYAIHGDESGPVIQTAELTNRASLSYRPSLISTASASTELSVRSPTSKGGDASPAPTTWRRTHLRA